jgi:hypothetical protein
MSHQVGRRYKNMFDWDPEAPRAARQCEDNFNLSKYRWTSIAAEEEEEVNAQGVLKVLAVQSVPWYKCTARGI